MKQPKCNHSNTKTTEANTRLRKGVLISYHCNDCHHKWRVYYVFADDSMNEIVSIGEIRTGRLIRERGT